MEVRLGEVVTVNYRVINEAARPITASGGLNVAPSTPAPISRRSTASASPSRRLKAGEKREMPVVFYVDRDGEGCRRQRHQHHHAVLHHVPGPRASRDGSDSAGSPPRELTRGDRNGRRPRQAAARLPSRRSEPVAGRRLDFGVHHGGRRHQLDAPHVRGGALVFFAGVIGVLYTMLGWWRDVIDEASTRAITPTSCRFRTATG